MVEEPLRHFADGVVRLPRDLVGAEDAERRSSAHDLDEHDADQAGYGDAVEQRVAPDRLSAGDEEGRRDECREQCDRLLAGEVGDEADAEEERRPERRRPLEPQHEHQRRGQEERVERVLRHQRGRVDHRRDRYGERRGDQRVAGREHAAREEVRGHRRERHHDRVDRLRRRVRLRHGIEQRPRGRDQHRVDDPVGGRRLVPHEEAPRFREALRELGVDQLVDHDPRGRRAAPEEVTDDRRHGDDAGQPGPDRY